MLLTLKGDVNNPGDGDGAGGMCRDGDGGMCHGGMCHGGDGKCRDSDGADSMCRGDDIDGEVQTSVIYSFLYLNNINLIHMFDIN